MYRRNLKQGHWQLVKHKRWRLMNQLVRRQECRRSQARWRQCQQKAVLTIQMRLMS